MAKAEEALKHRPGTYPVQEEKERTHLEKGGFLKRNWKKFAIGGAGVAFLVGGLAYKPATNNNQVSTEDIQRALIPQDKKVEVVKKNYGQEAKDLNAGVLPIEDYSSKFEVGEFTLKKNPDPDFWNSVYKAIIKYNSTLADKHFTIVGIREINRKEMDEIIEPDVKSATKMAFPDFKTGYKVAIMFDNRDLSKYIFIQQKDGISVYRETAR